MLLNKGKWNRQSILKAETINLMFSDHLADVMMIQLPPYRHLGLRNRIQDFVNTAIIN